MMPFVNSKYKLPVFRNFYRKHFDNIAKYCEMGEKQQHYFPLSQKNASVLHNAKSIEMRNITIFRTPRWLKKVLSTELIITA